METFKATLAPMMVMFLCIIIGYVLKRKKLSPEGTDKILSKLENYVFVPALILSTFNEYCTIESLKSNATLIGYSAIALVVALVMSIPLSYLFVKTGDYYQRNVYKYALSFGNFSFMGSAIVPAILGGSAFGSGDEVLYYYLLFTLPLNLAVYTWGIMILIPKGQKPEKNPLSNLLNPIFISILIGATLGLTGWGKLLPEVVTTTIGYCKGCMAPLAMILTGFVVGEYELPKLLRNGRVYIATGLRLVMFPLLILAVLKLLAASDLVIVLALFAYATPLGLNTVVFPAAYGGETETGASMAMISHTLCIISIPLMYTLINWLLSII